MAHKSDTIEQIQLAQLWEVITEGLGRIADSQSNLLALATSQQANGVLFSGTARLDAAGLLTMDFVMPYAAVFVVNSTLALLTVANFPLDGTAVAPGQGQTYAGLAALGNVSRAWHLAGELLSFQGSAGAAFPLVVYSDPNRVNPGGT